MSLPDEPALDPILRDQRTGHQIAGLVVAERPDQEDLAAQRNNVARHVGRPAEHDFLGLMVKDRNWRFRRNPLDASIHELVEHHVAKNEDPRSPPLGDPGRIHFAPDAYARNRLIQFSPRRLAGVEISGALPTISPPNVSQANRPC